MREMEANAIGTRCFLQGGVSSAPGGSLPSLWRGFRFGPVHLPQLPIDASHAHKVSNCQDPSCNALWRMLKGSSLHAGM